MASTASPDGGAPLSTPGPPPASSTAQPRAGPKPGGKWSGFFSAVSSASVSKKHKSKPSARAAKLIAKGDIDEALEIVEEALRALDAVENAPVPDDDRASLHALCAMCHSRNESTRRACEHFAAALDAAEEEEAATGRRAAAKGPKGPIDAEFFYRMGEACHRRGQHGRCALAYEQASELDPRRKKLPSRLTPSAVHHQAGVSCREIKRYEEALEHFAKVDAPLEAAVGSGDVLCDMERCHASMGDYAVGGGVHTSRSRRSRESSQLTVRPENVCRVAVYRYERCGGSAERAVKELAGVIENKDKTSLSKKKEAEVLAMLARLRASLGQLDASEANFEASLGRNPRSHGTWLSLGQLYEATARDDLALRAYARVVEICDEDDDETAMSESSTGRRRRETVQNRTDARTGRRRSSGGRVRRGGEAGARRGEGGGGAALRGGVRASRPAAQGAQVLRALDGRFAPGDSRGTGDGGADAMRALKVQRVFRGNKAREEARRRATARSVARHYGARGLRGGGRRGGRRAQRVDGGKLRAAMGRVAAGEAGVESSVLQDGGAAT